MKLKWCVLVLLPLCCGCSSVLPWNWHLGWHLSDRHTRSTEWQSVAMLEVGGKGQAPGGAAFVVDREWQSALGFPCKHITYADTRQTAMICDSEDGWQPLRDITAETDSK